MSDSALLCRVQSSVTCPGHCELGKAALWELEGSSGRATLIFRDKSYRKGAEKEQQARESRW